MVSEAVVDLEAVDPVPALGWTTVLLEVDALTKHFGGVPAVDLVASGTLRPELLVGQPGAEAITEARAKALGS